MFSLIMTMLEGTLGYMQLHGELRTAGTLTVKLVLAAVPAIGLLICTFAVCRVWWRPYGHREAYMRLVDRALHDYASDHGGTLPDGPDPYSALAKLYPKYDGSDGSELAGLTGNIAQVTNALRLHRSISNFTSFVYVPGLHENANPNLAVLWEKHAYLLGSGAVTPFATRPVLLLSRDFTNVPIAGWKEFETQQVILQRHSMVPSKPAP